MPIYDINSNIYGKKNRSQMWGTIFVIRLQSSSVIWLLGRIMLSWHSLPELLIGHLHPQRRFRPQCSHLIEIYFHSPLALFLLKRIKLSLTPFLLSPEVAMERLKMPMAIWTLPFSVYCPENGSSCRLRMCQGSEHRQCFPANNAWHWAEWLKCYLKACLLMII